MKPLKVFLFPQKPADVCAFGAYQTYGNTVKPVYIVTKIHKAEKFQQQHPQFQKFGVASGFVIFRKSNQ